MSHTLRRREGANQQASADVSRRRNYSNTGTLSSVGAGNEPARPSENANKTVFTAESVLDKIFEPGMLLGRSLQLLEDDFSIQNLQCIPQDFVLRESCKFDFNFGQKCEYIHIMIGHIMASKMPEGEEKSKEALVVAMMKASVAETSFFGADRLKSAKWPDSILSRPDRCSKTASPLLIYAPLSGLVSRCEAQIFSILVRSIVYAPILTFGQGSELVPQANGCCLVLLQHILALELLGKKQSALKEICPVVLTCSAKSFSSTLDESVLESFLKILPSGFDEKTGTDTHKVAKILLGRIGISPRERTVREIFEELLELFKGKTRSTDGDSVFADVIAGELLKALGTQIVEVKSRKFKVSCPQGEEVINWLNSIGWGTMSATFAEREVCSLLDIMNLPENVLHQICQEKVEEEGQSFPNTKEGLYLNLRSSIDDLKTPKNKFNEKAKALQDRLDGFRDREISWANALFAQHSLEIIVTKPVSLVLFSLLMASTNALFLLDIVSKITMISNDPNHGIGFLGSSVDLRKTLNLSFNTLMTCALIPVVSNLGRAPWRNPKDTAQVMHWWLGICFSVFTFKQATMITQCFLFEHSCKAFAREYGYDYVQHEVANCSGLCAGVVLSIVLVVCARYLAIIFMLVGGLVLTVNGSVYFGTQTGYTVIALSLHIFGVFVLLGLMLLIYKRHQDSKRLRHEQQKQMLDYNGASVKLLQCGNVTFVRAKLLGLRITGEDPAIAMEETIQRFADATHISRDRASRAGHVQDSWLAEMLTRIRAMMGMTEKISVSMRLKRGCSGERERCLVEVRQALESAMDVGRSHVRLYMVSHSVPASVASLNVLCDKIMDELAVQRSQDTAYARTYGPQQCWRKVLCLMIRCLKCGLPPQSNDVEAGAEEVGVRYSVGGKQLQHTTSIDELFSDAQLLNNPFHTEIKSLLQPYGDACEFIPGPIKTPSRAIEKVVRRYCVTNSFVLSPVIHFFAFVGSHITELISDAQLIIRLSTGTAGSPGT
jgi:hypothetical protein